MVRDGFAAVTTAMIATAAGASKQAIYRRWPTKADVVLEAFLAQARADVDEASDAGPGDPLARFLRRSFAALQSSGSGLRSLMAAAQEDPAFLTTFRDRFVAPRRAALRAVLAESVGEGASAHALDVGVIALFGALWYRLLLDEPLDDALADELAALAKSGLRGRSESE